MREATREAFELFVEQERRLAGCRYYQWLQANRGTALQIGLHQDGSLMTQHKRPDEDATQALVLTFRQFIQKDDRNSFRWLANNALDDPGLSEQWRQGFTKMRDELNNWLDSPSSLRRRYERETVTRGVPAMQEGQLTKREIMDVFINGDYAHGEPPKRKTFRRWKANPVWFQMAQFEFDYILMGALPAIWNVARLSDRELKRTP